LKLKLICKERGGPLFIKKLSLKNFRNYETAELEFTKNINIMIGNNAQGKTSLNEGIYALSTTKSHRTSKDIQMIRFEQEFAKVDTVISLPDDDDVELSLSITKKGKTAKYNGVPASKLSGYVGKLKTVFFAPEDLELIKGSPTIRRRFLNMEIGQIDPLYIHHLASYSKILKQRNELLKNYVESESGQLMLEVLTEQLVPHLVYLLNKRSWFLKSLEVHGSKVHAFITNSKEDISFKYVNSMRIDDITADALMRKFESLYVNDKRMRTTTVGAHRDDFLVCLSDMNEHEFASQGQQRTAILSIKLAEIDLIHATANVYPVLLLDDVLSELDDTRQIKLLASMKDKTQTFITTTSIAGIDEQILNVADVFRVDEGKIEYEADYESTSADGMAIDTFFIVP
jgi:DNA replication and repair protein RecF